MTICVLALMGISIESILWVLCLLPSFMLIVSLGKTLEELRLCNQGWSTIIGLLIWFLFFLGFLTLLPHTKPSDNPSLFYPYTTMIAFLLPYAAGGLGLVGVTLLGFVLDVFRKRKEPAD
jgi:hypothetical protein